MRFSPFYKSVEKVWRLRFRTAPDIDHRDEIGRILKKYCRFINMNSIRRVNNELEGERMDYGYHLVLKDRVDEYSLLDELSELETLVVTRMTVRDEKAVIDD